MNMQGQNLLLEKQDVKSLTGEAIGLLKELIAIPSFSRKEEKTAALVSNYLQSKNVKIFQKKNNIWAFNKHFDDVLPSILLCSHHDTVRPNPGYTLNPFMPLIKDGKLFGLGSNDAGGALVSLMAAFLYFHGRSGMKYNFIFAAAAEEEISGTDGIESVLPELGEVNASIVGEPTQMQLAVAEKGLMVLDCIVYGKPGHAARDEGENAIYKAIKDIEWFRNYRFPKISETLGPVKMNVTIIHSGSQHNVVPAECTFTVDVRTTDLYRNEEVLEIIRKNVSCEVKPRSLRLNSSSIAADHPLVKAGILAGRKTYGSPTTSDQALMNFPSLKLGPGDPARSHMADEFIYLDEIKEGIELYIKILNQIT